MSTTTETETTTEAPPATTGNDSNAGNAGIDGLDGAPDGGPRTPSKRAIRIAGLVIALVLIAAAGSGLAWSRHLTIQAHQRYDTAISAQAQTLTSLNASLGDAKTLLADSDGKVDDDQTRTDLADLIDDAAGLAARQVTVDPDDASRAELDHAAAQAQAVADQATSLTDQITQQITAVKASIATKELADAKATLASAIESAQKQVDAAQAAITSSDGQVADNQVRADADTARDALAKQIETAKKISGDDPAAYRDTAKALGEAGTGLAAKTKAVTDAQAAWQQAQAASAAAAPSASYTGSGSLPSSGYTPASDSSTWGGGGSSSTQPAPSTPSTGSGTPTGTGDGNSGGGWVETSEDMCGGGDEFGNTWEVPCG
jgi:hypothetical protein